MFTSDRALYEPDALSNPMISTNDLPPCVTTDEKLSSPHKIDPAHPYVYVMSQVTMPSEEQPNPTGEGRPKGQPAESKDRFGFMPTMWTILVGPAGTNEEEIRLEALGRLLTTYESPLKSYLKTAMSRFRVNEEWVQDCFQSFVEKKIMKRLLIEKADRRRGRFRDLLKTSLYRFAITELQRNGRHPVEPIEPDSPEIPDEAVTPDQPRGSDIEWAYEVLKQSLNLLRNGIERKGQRVHMVVFARRRLPVLLGDAEIESLDETVAFVKASLGETISRDEVSNRQKTTERTLREHLISVLSDYCCGEEEILKELKHVCDYLVAANRDACYDHIRRGIKDNFR